MRKNDFIAQVAKKTGLTQKEADTAFVAIFEEITQLMMQKDELVILGFGKFSTAIRKAREYRNLHTGGTIKTPKTTVPKFKISPALKLKVNR